YTFRLIAYSFSAFSFQIQYLPCFGRGSDFASQFLSDTNDLSYQLAIGFCQHPFFEIQIIFEPHSDISSHSDSRSSQSKGMASDTGCSPGRTCRNSIYKPAKIRNCCRRTPGDTEYKIKLHGSSRYLTFLCHIQYGFEMSHLETFVFRF